MLTPAARHTRSLLAFQQCLSHLTGLRSHLCSQTAGGASPDGKAFFRTNPQPGEEIAFFPRPETGHNSANTGARSAAFQPISPDYAHDLAQGVATSAGSKCRREKVHLVTSGTSCSNPSRMT